MISEKMQKALNDQINAELYSSYLYLSMSAYFQSESWQGFAKWMKAQADEEYSHAMKIFDYINEVGGRVTLEAIDKPKYEWKSVLEVFEETLKHELYVTDRINKLADLAVAEKDHATNIFLHWFVEEQIEEVATANQIVADLKKIGDSKGNLFMLDRQLGKREEK